MMHFLTVLLGIFMISAFIRGFSKDEQGWMFVGGVLFIILILGPFFNSEEFITPDSVFRDDKCVVAVTGTDCVVSRQADIVNAPEDAEYVVCRLKRLNGIGMPLVNSKEISLKEKE